jgi:VWFA-related protein
MATRAPAGAALLVLLASPPARPQATAPAPVFPAKADIVRLDLVVRDKAGRLVDDLRADEVRVLEDGQPCAVESFRLVQAEGPERPTQTRGEPAAPPSAAGPAVEPRPPAGEGLVSVVGLVFDQLGPEAARNARAAALQLAGRTFPRGSVLAVFKIGQGLSVLQSFTEDRARLAPAIEKATTGVDQARDPARGRGYDNATEEAFAVARQAQAASGAQGAASAEAAMLAWQARMLRFSDRTTREAQGQASLQPLLAIARGLALVQGRKSLLYFSEGLAVPPAVEEAFRATVSAANRANVSVYSFDARGLRVRSPAEETKLALGLATDAARGEQQGAGTLEGMLASETTSDALRLDRQGVLRDLAESTGGFLVADTNDLRPGLERAVADLRAYYEVGYVPPDPRADGRWRSIAVKVSRPGVVVRTRRGYYALPPGSPAVLPFELALAEALAASTMPREVEHRAATLHFAGGEAETETLVWVEVPAAGLAFAKGETTWRGHVSLLADVKDEKGTLVARMSHDAPLEGPLAEIEAARARTTVVKRTLRLPPGRYVLETAVQDRESGKVGARRTAFEIPAPGPALSLGSVAIVRADDAGGAPPAPDDPLRAGALRATPLLGRSFPEGTPSVSLLLSLYAGPSATAPEADLEIRRDGQPIARTPLPLPSPDSAGRITYVGSIPTGALPAGRYEAWVRGHLGDAEATEVTGFTIVPRGPSAAAARPPAEAAPPRPPGSIEDRKGVATPLATILERAGRYVLEYEETLRNLVAEESYRQWGPNPKVAEGQVVRTLRSDLVFVRLPGPLPWGTFRDVYEVDGQKVRDRERRLEKLFFAPKASDFEQAEAILNESSRYNLGRAYRNINVPALGLLFLRPENQRRLAFRRKGTRTIAGFPTVEVAFEERTSPTLVHDRWANDVPASGRFWVDETRGTVLRTEIDYDLETEKSKRTPDSWEHGLVSTEYRREGWLGAFVPDTMTELYAFRGLGRVEGVARYAKYRRFDVAVGTTEVLPLTYPEGADAAAAASLPAEPPPPEPPLAPEPPPAPRPEPSELPMQPAPELPGAVGSLLRKAGDRVLRYEEAFRNVVAEERYEQRSSVRETPQAPAAPQRLRSEVVFAMLPGPVPWTLLRDVLEADGHVRRRDGRLEPLFRASPSAGLREAGAIARESETLIQGPTQRTLNVPTTALAYLHPDNRDAFRFVRRGRATVGREETVAVAFEEVGRPTLNQDGAGGDVPVRGTFWLRESDGTVLRSRTELAFAVTGAPQGRMTVTTEYRDDPALGLPAPVEMTETLEWHTEQARKLTCAGPKCQMPAYLTGAAFATVTVRGGIEGKARYSGFRRIQPGVAPPADAERSR